MIKLLNGKEFDEIELIEKMADDNFYYNDLSKFTDNSGNIKPLTLNSSGCKSLYKSPKVFHYSLKYSQGESQPLRDGKLFHWAILEPEKFAEQTFVDVQSKNSKAYRLAKEENPNVFTIKEKKDTERLMDAFYRNEKAVSYIRKCEFEVPMIKDIMGYPFRGKADVYCQDRLVDIKTTSGGVENFPYSAKKYGYDIQAFVYCELFNVPYKDFTFVVIDKGSLDIGIYDVSEEFYLSGKNKVERALENYHTFYNLGEDINSYYIQGTL